MLGQWGDRVGDVILYWNPPYSEALISGIAPETYALDFAPDIYPFKPFTDLTGRYSKMAQHHPFLPWATYKGLSNSGVAIVAGPGVKSGYRRATGINLVDVLPTVCHLCELPLPRNNEGKIVSDMLESR